MSQDCGCTDPIPVSSDCSECSVECPSTHNSSCIVYNGEALSNLDIVENQGLNDVLEAINDALQAEIIEDKISIPSANVKLLYSTPYTLIIAPGSGKYINLISLEVKMDSGSTPYGVSGDYLIFKSTNASNTLLQVPDDVLTTTNTNIVSVPTPVSAYDTIRVNDSFVIAHDSANPTAGDGVLTVYLTYTIKTV